jgi:hypothetical protein
LITVLPRHFLAIVVLQCDVDRDVGLKLNFSLISYFSFPRCGRTPATKYFDRSDRA